MALTVKLPSNCVDERQYVCRVLLCDFLGMNIRFQIDGGDCVRIVDTEGKSLSLNDAFFGSACGAWLHPDTLPQQCPIWDTRAAGLDGLEMIVDLPVLFGQDPEEEDFFTCSPLHISLGLDIFGSAFFMLSRYEEAAAPQLDGHQRCVASGSIAAKFGFLHRPIVDEYTEILWACMTRLWPRLKRKIWDYTMAVSHDVDKPYEYAFLSPEKIARTVGSELLNKGNISGALAVARSWMSARVNISAPDPCENFDAIMDASEERGVISAFYFIVDRPAGDLDCDYPFHHPLIQRLIQRISRRGHEIGLHGSYFSYCDPSRLAFEFGVLQEACSRLGVKQSNWGSRQHFLRWKTPDTFAACDLAGLNYDASLGYADHAGFRCGVCREYQAYDVKARHELKLAERPLIAMDCTIMDQRYMNLGTSNEALEALVRFKQICKRFGGTFSLLWHNSRMVDAEELRLYMNVLDA